MSEHIDHGKVAIDLIDAQLDAPLPSIQDAIIEAVAHGRMSLDEAKECIDAYERSFHCEDVES